MTATPKEVAEEYFRLWNSGDFAGLDAIFADDMVWCIKGYFPEAGEFNRDQVLGMLTLIPKMDTVEPFLLHVTDMVADDRAVAVEFTGTMKFRDGRQYRNIYHFKLFVENGKITRGHEYLCTHTAVTNGIGADIAKAAAAAAAA